MSYEFNIPKLEDMQYLCDIMYDSFKLSTYFLDKNGNILFEASKGYINNPMFPSKIDMFRTLIQENIIYNFPILKTNSFLEDFFYIAIKNNDSYIGTFIAGPSLSSTFLLENIDEIITNFNISLSCKKDVFNYYNQLPVISHHTLFNYSLILYYTIYKTKLDISYVEEKNYTLRNSDKRMHNSLDLALSKTRINAAFHPPYEYAQYLFQCIKEGNKKNLLEYIHSSYRLKIRFLSKNNLLRNIKNNFIRTCALATNAAIEGGVYSEIVYNLNDEYVEHMEELTKIQDVIDLSNKMLLDFADNVQAANNHPKYSKHIIYCQNFIFNQIYEDISLVQLSQAVKLSPNYLSELFSKEVGITISEYIQKERVKEAQKLLVLTNKSLSEICELLNFGAQSYFSTIFKKYTEFTPKEYRKLKKVE